MKRWIGLALAFCTWLAFALVPADQGDAQTTATAFIPRHGTTAEQNNFTGAEGELTADWDKYTIVMHDGVTVGGHPLAKELELDQHLGDFLNPHQVTAAQCSAVALTDAFSGDVTGPYNATVVGKLLGRTIDATAPSANQVYAYISSVWQPTTITPAMIGAASQGANGDITSLTATETVALNGTTSGTVTLDAPATVTSYNLTLPNAVPAAASYILVSSDGAGNFQWTDTTNMAWVGVQNFSAVTTMQLPQSASPAPTAEGDFEWDTDDEFFRIGTGAGNAVFQPMENIAGDLSCTDGGTCTVDASFAKATGDTYSGGHDFTTATVEVPNSATPPACVDGQIYYDTDRPSGNRLLACETTTWVPQGVAGSGDSVSVDGAGTVDPDFVSTGDIDFVNTSNTITAEINGDAAGPTEIDETADYTFTGKLIAIGDDAPATCTAGSLFIDQNGNTTGVTCEQASNNKPKLCVCTAANTWKGTILGN